MLGYDPDSISLSTSDFFLIYKELERNFISIPRIYSLNDKLGVFIGEYVKEDMCNVLIQYPDFIEKYFTKSLEILSSLQGITEFSPVQFRKFDKEKFTYEMNFLEKGTRKGFEVKSISFPELKIVKIFEPVIDFLTNHNQYVFAHRDFHSRNILVSGIHQPELKIIDYQDARMGHPYYDLVSLVFDPYLNVYEKINEFTIEKYSELSGFAFNHEIYYASALQRILKALGSYLYLVFEKKQEKYIPSISNACDVLLFIKKYYNPDENIYIYSEEVRYNLS